MWAQTGWMKVDVDGGYITKRCPILGKQLPILSHACIFSGQWGQTMLYVSAVSREFIAQINAAQDDW